MGLSLMKFTYCIVLVYMDLKRFNTETFLADRSELLEFLHGGFLLDYYYHIIAVMICFPVSLCAKAVRFFFCSPKFRRSTSS